MKRDLSIFERRVIEGVAQKLSPAAAANLIDDMYLASVEDQSSPVPIVRFDIDGYERPQYRGQHTYPVEVVVHGEDGRKVSALLYADENNRLFELELIVWEGPGVKDLDQARIDFYG